MARLASGPLALSALLLVASAALAQDTGTLKARLLSASEETSLDLPDLHPWHLKLTVQLFDQKGKPSEQGTIEEWWIARDSNRVSFAFPSFTATELHTKDGFFRTKTADTEPPVLFDILENAIHPMPLGEMSDAAKPDLRKQKFGKVSLDCIMLDEPLKNLLYPPLGLFPTYCLDTGKNDLRLSTDLGSITIIRNRIGTFQGRSVALDLVANDGTNSVATAHIDALTGLKPEEADLTPGPGMELTDPKPKTISGSVLAGSILNKVQPVYPEAARLSRTSGSVVLRALIGRDGRIRHLRVVSTPDPDLAMSAFAAVHRWTYKPYLLNGVPTEVDTTITVNYAFGP